MYIYDYMNSIKFRIARCDTLYDDTESIRKVICFSVERSDNLKNQISVCGELSGSQCIGKSDEECVDVAFNLLTSSLSVAVNKLLSSSGDIVGSYYIPQ